MNAFAIAVRATLASAVLVPLSSAQIPTRFEEVGAKHGLQAPERPPGMGWGAAAADYDGDGDVDVFVPAHRDAPDQLYRNDGSGNFEEIAQDVGLASLAGNRAALWFDYDGDGDLDLVVTGEDCFVSDECAELSPEPKVILYRQEPDGTFTDVTAASGLAFPVEMTTTSHVAPISAGDMDADGDLDLVLGVWGGLSGVYRNEGDGTFTDVTTACGFVPPGSEWQAQYDWQKVWHDFDGDGFQDIYVAVDFGDNRLMINQGDGTFVDVAPLAGADNRMNDMGVALGDYDNDGDFDIYITNVWDNHGNGEHNVLLRNDSQGGTLSFVDVAFQLEVAQGFWGWGTTFFDADRDGWLDLAATNGFMNGGWQNDPSRFFVNGGAPGVPFREAARALGAHDRYWGSALLAFDYDRDGDLDMLQTTSPGSPLRLLENHPQGATEDTHWICIRPRMHGMNTHAIGAVVRVEVDGLVLSRLITAGTSFLGQEPAEAYFGVGTATQLDSVTVEWPDATETTWTDVPVDFVRTVMPGGTTGDLDMDMDVDVEDYGLLMRSWGVRGASAADLDGDGRVGRSDLLILLAHWD